MAGLCHPARLKKPSMQRALIEQLSKIKHADESLPSSAAACESQERVFAAASATSSEPSEQSHRAVSGMPRRLAWCGSCSQKPLRDLVFCPTCGLFRTSL